ncbi:transcription factor HES-5-like [Lampris incognitus]|uniref:transcription factor HES-5-like n=1 Tax=Lampris incognitus TaxID=2546036 RepID=UPI0024B4D305|nr:transcription factor HES-5-like [Lampris incognitus]
MAPVQVDKVTRSGKGKIKLRKPAVEKKRRDRINSSIEQLKALLEKELQALQPTSKLEKAIILETAVGFLRGTAAPAFSGSTSGSAVCQSYAEGFARCLQETLRFLSAYNQRTRCRQALVNHGTAATCAGRSGAPRRVGGQAHWRPW